MQTLSDRQLREVTRIIDDHHTAFIIQIGLGDFVPPEQVNRLVRLGLVSKSQVKKGFTEDAFAFGFLADALAESKAKNMDLGAFKEWLAHRSVPLGREERAAVKSLRRSVFTHIKGLGGRVDKHTQQVINDADQDLRRRVAASVKRELVEGVEHRKAIGEIVGALRKATQRYTQDWSRIAVTEMNNAFQEGKLATIQKSNKGRDPWVFKRVRPDACKECKHAYLTKSGAPRLFRLSELLAAGSNVDRARGDRRPTVKSHHPWCQCELQEMPPGFEFDSKGRMRYAGLGS